MAAYQGGQRSGRGKRKAPARPTASKPSDKRTNFPGGRTKPKPKPTAKPQRQGPPVPARLQQAPKPPVLPASVQTVAARPAARPSTPARPTTSSRRPAPKPPAASSAPKALKVAQTSGIGPVKSGTEYARKKGSLREQARKLREMQAESRKRQGK